ncbi:hypothetical protein H8356DRAFT_1327865 [Neocallimastix lanati (nom. inval.)]|nr:hypothetical protein H8356DRAFT_1327865 [Neocallimastix sp. JGI-2020a]
MIYNDVQKDVLVVNRENNMNNIESSTDSDSKEDADIIDLNYKKEWDVLFKTKSFQAIIQKRRFLCKLTRSVKAENAVRQVSRANASKEEDHNFFQIDDIIPSQFVSNNNNYKANFIEENNKSKNSQSSDSDDSYVYFSGCVNYDRS